MENSTEKMFICAIVCCHGKSLQYTHMNEKQIPGVLLNLHGEWQELKPKVETNISFLVLHPSSGVDTVRTVGSHLKTNEFRNKRLSRIQKTPFSNH